MNKNSFESFDKANIFYRYWDSKTKHKTAKKAIVLLHAEQEHYLRIAHLVDELGLDEFKFFAWDMRGYGNSKNADTVEFAELAKDLSRFVEHIKQEYKIEEQNIAIIGEGLGASIAALWTHDYVPDIRALILAAPAFDMRSFIPFKLSFLNLAYNLNGDFRVKNHIKVSRLTHDSERVALREEDSEITKDISVKVLLGLYAASRRVVEDARSISTPTQIFSAGSDWVVKTKPQKKFFDNLGSPLKEHHELPNFYHDIFGEKDRHLALERVKRFLLVSFEEEPEIPSLLDADKIGYTRVEADKLSLSSGFFKNRYWNFQKALLRYAGKISNGAKLGLEKGFGSESSLAYIYANQPSGTTNFGALADFIYLRFIGYRALRERKANQDALVDIYSQRLKSDGKKVNIAEIKSLEPMRAKPTIAIAAGFYELLDTNDEVKSSLASLSKAMSSGSFLIYTAQPWHPKLEYIARVLLKDGKPPRRRTQREMDQLVENAGFKKIDTRIDIWGICTVSVAVKV